MCHLGLIFFLILGLQIFFQNIKVGGGIKIKITKKIFLFNLKHIWIGEKKKKNIVISAFLQCKIIQSLLFFFF